MPRDDAARGGTPQLIRTAQCPSFAVPKEKALCALAHGSGRGDARTLHCWIAARNNARSFLKVTIADAAGRTLLDTTSEGPWFLAKVPAGNYQIVATFAGNAEKRTIAVGTEKLKTIDFRWGAE